MNLLSHLLVATALIAALILLRLFADRQALRTRIRQHHTDTECEQATCFRGCDLGKDTASTDLVAEKNDSNRSAYHAP
jgi:hypothetical protein